MLVLTRKAQQSIRIGDSIKVTILRVKGNTVRVGVQAPESVRIVRSELPDYGTPRAEVIEEEIEIPLTAPLVPRLRRQLSPHPGKSGETDARQVPLPAPKTASFSPESSVARPR
jgi:carbon storage regulator CsrA